LRPPSGIGPTTATPVILNIYDTTSATLVFSDTQTVAIPETSTVSVSFNPFTIQYNRVYALQVISEEPLDPFHYNDTLTSYVSTIYVFGDVVGEWNFPTLGDGSGYSLAGITYVPDSGKFYVITLNPPNTVFSFDPTDPAGTFTQADLYPHTFFGAEESFAFGIAYHNGTFYISTFGYDGSAFTGSMIGYYDGAGNLYDSLDVWSVLESGGWLAGMDWDYTTNTLFGVYSGGSNSIYMIDPDTKTSSDTFPNVASAPLSGISALGPGGDVYYGGWGPDTLYRVSYDGTLLAAVPMVGFADGDFWKYCPDPEYPLFLFITLSDAQNTILKVASGHYCGDLPAVSELPKEGVSAHPKVSGRRITVSGEAVVYDASGRLVARFEGTYTLPKAGVFFVRTGGRTYRIIAR